MKMFFTKDSISDLHPDILPVLDVNGRRIGEKPNPSGRPYVIYDLDRSSPPGFGLYVGRKLRTFIMQVRVGKSVRKVSIGEYGPLTLSKTNLEVDARTVAFGIRGELKRGKSVAEAKKDERSIRDTTLGDILDAYVEAYARRNLTKQNTLNAVEAARKRMEPWLGLSVRSIGTKIVHEIWDEIAIKQGHRTAAEQTLTWCRAAFNHYLDERQHDSNLVAGGAVVLVNPFRAANKLKRTRDELEEEYDRRKTRNPLKNTPDGLGRWLDVVWGKRASTRSAADYMLTTLLLGARRNETAKLVWWDRVSMKELAGHNVVDLDKGTVRFTKTKNNKDHEVPIGRHLKWVLLERYRKYPLDEWVFPSSSKNPDTTIPYYSDPRSFILSLREIVDKPFREAAYGKGLSRLKQEYVDARKRFTKASERAFDEHFQTSYSEQSPFTMHDLRRTFVTVAAEMEGIPYPVVRWLVNHSARGDVTARYLKANIDRARPHMQRIEDELLKHASLLPRITVDV